MLKIAFLLSSFLLVLFMLVYKLFVNKLKNNFKTYVLIPALAIILLFYILTSFVFGVFVNGIYNKIIILLLGFSPFIIGKFATYEKETLYSYLQIFVVAFGIFYVLIML